MLSLRRLAIAASLVLVFLVTLYCFPSGRDVARQRLATALAQGSAALAPGTPPPRPQDAAEGQAEPAAARVELVVSSVVADNTSWITDYFPHYPAHIYVADDPYAPLTVKHNIGHESAVYLTCVGPPAPASCRNRSPAPPPFFSFLHVERHAETWPAGTSSTTMTTCPTSSSSSTDGATSGTTRTRYTVRAPLPWRHPPASLAFA